MKNKMDFLHAYELAHELKSELADVCDHIEIAGSIRRKCDLIGDIEFVARPKYEIGEHDLFGIPTWKSMLWPRLDAMSAERKIVYTKTGNLYRQFLWPQVQVDLFTATAENWGWILLMRTGSADFSHRVARCLNREGFTSAGGNIIDTRDGRTVSTPSEQDVFRLAGMEWLEPKHRL